VGRRLAYDAKKGRLWVVCPRCERWNLTPLETRWEAIEQAEREYRATRLRRTTDNIGLAQLNEGLQLVRIGAPPRLELAGWRYGDQFGRRRRKYIAYTAAGFAVATVPWLGVYYGVGLLSGGSFFAYTLFDLFRNFRNRNVSSFAMRNDSGEMLYFTKMNAADARLEPIRETGDWCLRIMHSDWPVTTGWRKYIDFGNPDPLELRTSTLRGASAQAALALLLPHINQTGGSEKRVREAVGVIGQSANTAQLILNAANHGPKDPYMSTSTYVTKLPAPMRLALEMVLHEDDEQRAMEGEHAELERRWREADAIANIADSLLLPDTLDERLEEMRTRAGVTKGE